MHCPACGSETPDGAQFCGVCGASLSASVARGAGIGPPELSMVNFPDAVKLGFQRYVDFKGRSSKAEYWWWTLFTFLGGFALAGLGSLIGDIDSLPGLFSLGVLIPGIAVGVRRLHDLGKSGWWLLLVFAILIGWIILIVWFVTRGTSDPNQYGQRVNKTDNRFASNHKVITAVFITVTLLLGVLPGMSDMGLGPEEYSGCSGLQRLLPKFRGQVANSFLPIIANGSDALCDQIINTYNRPPYLRD